MEESEFLRTQVSLQAWKDGVLAAMFSANTLSERRVRQGTEMETLVSEFADRVTSCSPDQLDDIIKAALSRVLVLFNAGRVCWYVDDLHKAYLERVFSCARPGVGASPLRIEKSAIPYTIGALAKRRTIRIGSIDSLPADASADRRFFDEQGIYGTLLATSNRGTGRKGIFQIAFMPALAQVSPYVEGLRDLSDMLVAAVERRRFHILLGCSGNGLRVLAQNAPFGIALEDLDGNLLFVNPALCRMLGYSESELLAKRYLELCDSVDKRQEEILFGRLQRHEIDRYTIEKPIRRKDGVEIWGRNDVFRIQAEARNSPFLAVIMQDITSRKRADLELESARTEQQKLARYLIHAQEEERHRISRDLHDDIGQRLSLLAIELDSLAEECGRIGLMREASQANSIKAMADGILTDLHEISHQLHSVKLKHLGLKSAIEELLGQVKAQNELSIEFEVRGAERKISEENALCLFRITQEALGNIIRHSGAKKAIIKLEVSSTAAKLSVRDLGVGFDVGRTDTGLGLVSMRERLRMAGGELKIESRKGGGTSILASLPFPRDKS